jgi:hypothetical protein
MIASGDHLRPTGLQNPHLPARAMRRSGLPREDRILAMILEVASGRALVGSSAWASTCPEVQGHFARSARWNSEGAERLRRAPKINLNLSTVAL